VQDSLTLSPIAYLKSDFKEKFGIPRQSGLVPSLQARICLLPEYACAEAFRGIEGFTHLWLIWGFSAVPRGEWSPTVRPPRLGGNARMGVFATRAPYRPNPIGLSCVRLLSVESTEGGTVLHVGGADLLDGTPIYDIKPYLPYTDAHTEAVGGFSTDVLDYALEVQIPPDLLARVPVEKRDALVGILAQDPRPQYQHDPTRVYGLSFADFTVRFTVSDGRLCVTDLFYD